MKSSAQLIKSIQDKGMTISDIARSIGAYAFNVSDWAIEGRTPARPRQMQLEALAGDHDVFYIVRNIVGDHWVVTDMSLSLEAIEARMEIVEDPDVTMGIIMAGKIAPWYEGQSVKYSAICKFDWA